MVLEVKSRSLEEAHGQEDSLLQKEVRVQLAVIEQKIDDLALDVGRRLVGTQEKDGEVMHLQTFSLREKGGGDAPASRSPRLQTATSRPPSAPAPRAWAPDQSIGKLPPGPGWLEVQSGRFGEAGPASTANRPASRPSASRPPTSPAMHAWEADSGMTPTNSGSSKPSLKLQAPESARPSTSTRGMAQPPQTTLPGHASWLTELPPVKPPRKPSADEAWVISSLPKDLESFEAAQRELSEQSRGKANDSARRALAASWDPWVEPTQDVTRPDAAELKPTWREEAETHRTVETPVKRPRRSSRRRSADAQPFERGRSSMSGFGSNRMKMRNFRTFLKGQIDEPSGRSSLREGMLKRMGWSQKAFSSTMEFEAVQATRLWQMVHSPLFQYMTSTMIMLNVITIGVSADVQLKSQIEATEMSPVYEYIDRGFSVFFAIELLFRIISEGRFFFAEPEWKWNLFDSTLVLLSGVDVIMFYTLDSAAVGNLAASRILRFARFIRIVRIARAVRAFHSLRIVVYAIFESMLSLGWCFIVVFLILYMFAVFFLFGVTEHIQFTRPQGEEMKVLSEFYGSVFRACVTLFMTISGGVDWNDAMQPLRAINWLYEPVFNFYVFFMVIGVLNVVVGAFVAATGDISNRDRDLLVKNEIKELQAYTGKVATFFKEADKDKSGCLSWDEFKEYLKVPKVSAYFQALELDVAQAHIIFKLLDGDESNEVNLEEFLQGCMRLKGPAKGIDLNMMMYEQKKMQEKLSGFMSWVHQRLDPPEQLVCSSLASCASSAESSCGGDEAGAVILDSPSARFFGTHRRRVQDEPKDTVH